MAGFKKRLEALTKELQEQAGIDSKQDRFVAGYIAACTDLLNVEFEENE